MYVNSLTYQFGLGANATIKNIARSTPSQEMLPYKHNYPLKETQGLCTKTKL